VRSTLSAAADAQNVPIVEALVYDEQLQVALIQAGDPMDALLLRMIGHAHQAWDIPQLTHRVRTYRLQNLHALIRHIFVSVLDNVFLMATSASKSQKV
jgi:hypothetical protein